MRFKESDMKRRKEYNEMLNAVVEELMDIVWMEFKVQDMFADASKNIRKKIKKAGIYQEHLDDNVIPILVSIFGKKATATYFNNFFDSDVFFNRLVKKARLMGIHISVTDNKQGYNVVLIEDELLVSSYPQYESLLSEIKREYYQQKDQQKDQQKGGNDDPSRLPTIGEICATRNWDAAILADRFNEYLASSEGQSLVQKYNNTQKEKGLKPVQISSPITRISVSRWISGKHNPRGLFRNICTQILGDFGIHTKKVYQHIPIQMSIPNLESKHTEIKLNSIPIPKPEQKKPEQKPEQKPEPEQKKPEQEMNDEQILNLIIDTYVEILGDHHLISLLLDSANVPEVIYDTLKHVRPELGRQLLSEFIVKKCS